MRRWRWAAAVALAVVLTIAGAAAGSSRPWLTSMVGLGGAVVLILGSKALGRRWLRRDERYYERLAERAHHVERAARPDRGRARERERERERGDA